MRIRFDLALSIFNLDHCCQMDLDIYTATKNWTFSEIDQRAEQKFSKLEELTRKSVPQHFYHKQTLCHLDFIKNSPLYSNLQSLPKGVLHHLHFVCCEDLQFYRRYVVTDSRVFLTADGSQMRLGTPEQAEKEGWMSMSIFRQKFQSQDLFLKVVASITMLTREQLLTMTFDQKQMWQRFQLKIRNFLVLTACLDIFKKYSKHMILKFIKNGYDRIEFRAFLTRLKQYDEKGRFVKEHDEAMYMQVIDEVYEEVRKEYPDFSVGFIFFGFKCFNAGKNEEIFTKICELNWDKTIGFDFVQEEDLYGSLSQYDQIVDRVLAKYPHLDYKKVYHAGETKNHRTQNVDVAIKAGSVRIGHGFNILQRIEFLPHCKNICFEKNPLSNLVLGYNADARQASAPILLGLGYAVTLSPDDPGKFGVEDSTVDYFLAAISYNWTLRHLKLIAYHSINHAICSEHTKQVLLKSFNSRWNNWVLKFVGNQKADVCHRWMEPDIYSGVRHWSWSEKQAQALLKFEKIRESSIDKLPEGFYQQKILSHLSFMRSQPLYQLFKTLPKGALLHDHFDCNYDSQFFRSHIITDPRIYLNKDRKSFKIGSTKQAESQGWISWTQIKKQFQDESALADYLYSLTSFSSEELSTLAGASHIFWQPFLQKIYRFNDLLVIKDVFSRYCEYILRKYIKNGYDRVEFRALLIRLKEYDKEDNFISEHDDKAFADTFDAVYQKIKQQYRFFSAGFIFFAPKCFSDEQMKATLRRVAQLNWKLAIGVDFVQQQDAYASLDRYDEIADRVLAEYPDMNLKKCYHAGETRNHKCVNIKIALKAGSVRIGHGINIIQHMEILPLCSKVCFQLCPISNLLTGTSASNDIRLSTAPILLGLGIPVSLNPDDPGTFGYEDSTADFFSAAVSFNWTLKHFKLLAIHSINHSICSEGTKLLTFKAFQERWQIWIEELLQQ